MTNSERQYSLVVKQKNSGQSSGTLFYCDVCKDQRTDISYGNKTKYCACCTLTSDFRSINNRCAVAYNRYVRKYADVHNYTESAKTDGIFR